MRKFLKFLSHRMVVITILIFLQLGWFVILLLRLTAYSHYLSVGLRVISILVIIYLMNRDDNPAVKLAWTVVILLLPLFGGLLYLYIGGKKPIRNMRRKMLPDFVESQMHMEYDGSIYGQLKEEDDVIAGQIYYLEKQAGFPAYRHSDATYYTSGEDCFKVMLAELKKAEQYIFLEYFIIEEGIMWDSVLEILEEKAAAGVDVRVMYDDVGCAFVLPVHYDRILREKGIKCVVFNRYIPLLSTVFNNRDHRKILVIDGETAFTGGINFADEYINEKQRFGYWKDNGVRLKGGAVRSMTVMFLQMWNSFSKERLPYQNYTEKKAAPLPTEGLILPYADHPLDSESVAENVYLNLIGGAKRYIYFFTPYLIIDNELSTALILAAKRGVDVKLITPGIPDKKAVFLATQSYYPQLVEGGVKIYQYRPGFVHSKCAVCDDKAATVGTINLDFRSLYFHFENGIYLYDCPAVLDIRDDIAATLADCTDITLELCRKNMFFQLLQGILRIFAPLL